MLTACGTEVSGSIVQQQFMRDRRRPGMSADMECETRIEGARQLPVGVSAVRGLVTNGCSSTYKLCTPPHRSRRQPSVRAPPSSKQTGKIRFGTWGPAVSHISEWRHPKQFLFALAMLIPVCTLACTRQQTHASMGCSRHAACACVLVLLMACVASAGACAGPQLLPGCAHAARHSAATAAAAAPAVGLPWQLRDAVPGPPHTLHAASPPADVAVAAPPPPNCCCAAPPTRNRRLAQTGERRQAAVLSAGRLLLRAAAGAGTASRRSAPPARSLAPPRSSLVVDSRLSAVLPCPRTVCCAAPSLARARRPAGVDGSEG
jgi:hypothetical protein